MEAAERDLQIYRMREQGMLIREICKEVGVCKNTVINAIKRKGQPARKPWYDNQMGLSEHGMTEMITTSYKSGISMKKIVADTNISIQIISRILKEKGLSPSGNLTARGIHSTTERNNVILAHRMDGLTYHQISEKLGISETVVYRTCRQSGVNDRLTCTETTACLGSIPRDHEALSRISGMDLRRSGQRNRPEWDPMQLHICKLQWHLGMGKQLFSQISSE